MGAVNKLQRQVTRVIKICNVVRKVNMTKGVGGWEINLRTEFVANMHDDDVQCADVFPMFLYNTMVYALTNQVAGVLTGAC